MKGRVVGPDGTPPVESLMICRLHIHPSSPFWRGFPETIRDGRFELHGCDPQQQYPVFFLDPKNQVGTTVHLGGKEGDSEQVTVTLERCGSAVAHVVDADGKPIAGYRPTIEIVVTPGPHNFDQKVVNEGVLGADADFVANVDRVNHWNGPMTDKQGSCTFEALIPGATYRLVDYEEGYSVVKKDFSVKPGETLELGDIVVKRPE